MDAGTPTEKLEYLRPSDLPGVEITRATCTSRLWRVFHTTYTVCTILDAGHGMTEWSYRNKIQHSRTGDLMLMEPGELHAGKKLVRTDHRTFCVLNIDPSVIGEAGKELEVAPSEPHFRMASISHPALFEAFVKFHSSLKGESTTLERQSLFASCVQLLLELCTETPPSTPRKYSCRPALLGAREFIYENSAPNATLDELATISGTSRFHLVRTFAREFGLTPHAFQTQVRIARSRPLLAAGQKLAIVASEMGFVDQSHFTHHFKRILGITPAEYARKATKPLLIKNLDRSPSCDSFKCKAIIS